MYLGSSMAQILDQQTSGPLVGYKQSFAGACWQMPELAAAGGDLAIPFEVMCRDELARSLLPACSASLGDTSVSVRLYPSPCRRTRCPHNMYVRKISMLSRQSIIDTLMSKHLLILSSKSSKRVKCALLEPLRGPKTRKALIELQAELPGRESMLKELLHMLNQASDVAPDSHKPIRSSSHGDLHGGNVMVDSRGNPWLIDCGMSKVCS